MLRNMGWSWLSEHQHIWEGFYYSHDQSFTWHQFHWLQIVQIWIVVNMWRKNWWISVFVGWAVLSKYKMHGVIIWYGHCTERGPPQHDDHGLQCRFLCSADAECTHRKKLQAHELSHFSRKTYPAAYFWQKCARSLQTYIKCRVSYICHFDIKT